MNEKKIIQYITPYIKNNTLSYESFDILFNSKNGVSLSLREQYEVIDIITNNGIEMVDENSDETRELEDDEESVEEIDDIEIDEYWDDNHDDSDIEVDFSAFQDADDFIVPETHQKVYKGLPNETLCKLSQNGDSWAKEYLCIKNRRLVGKYAYTYSHYFNNKLEENDLFQVGMIGLMKAIDKFDINHGSQFSTYAVWWIKQAITREIYDNGFTIRIPVHMMETINKISSLQEKLYQKLGREPTFEEIASETGYMSAEYIQEVLSYKINYHGIASTDIPISEDEDTLLIDMLPWKGESVEYAINQSLLKIEIQKTLSYLSEREQAILRLRFGLDDGIPKTLEEIGAVFNVTRERIRQIEANALRKLKHPTKSKNLKDFFEN